MMKLHLSRTMVGGLIFAGAGLVITVAASQLPIGVRRLPGPGAVPLVLGLMLLVLGLVLTSMELRSAAPAIPASAADGANDDGSVDPFGKKRVLLVAALIFAFVGMLPWFGFAATASLLMVALYAIGAEKPFSLYPLIAGLLTTAAAYLLFVLLLDVPMPTGRFWG